MSPYDRRIKTEAAPQDFRRDLLIQRNARPNRRWAATRIASQASTSEQQTDTAVGESEVIDLADFGELEAERLRSDTPFPEAGLKDEVDDLLHRSSPDNDGSERANAGDEGFNTSPAGNPTAESANTIDELLLLRTSSPRGSATSESTNTNDSRSTASIASSEEAVDIQGPPYYRITVITNGPPEKGILHKPTYLSPPGLLYYATQLRLRRARLVLTREWVAKYGFNSELPSFEEYATYAKSTNETQVRDAHELAEESRNARRSRIIRFDRGPPCFQKVNWDHERFRPAYPSPVKHSVTMEEWDMARRAENGWMLWIGNAQLAAYSTVEDAWD